MMGRSRLGRAAQTFKYLVMGARALPEDGGGRYDDALSDSNGVDGLQASVES